VANSTSAARAPQERLHARPPTYLAPQIEAIAAAIFHKPTSRNGHQLRYGRHGSVVVDIAGPKAGLYYNFETGEGGDAIDLVKRTYGLEFKDAVTMCDQLAGLTTYDFCARPRAAPYQNHDRTQRKAWALDIWGECVSLCGTPGEDYFVNKRKIDIGPLNVNHCLRWHNGQKTIVGLMRSPLNGNPVGIQRIYPKDGTKKMLGTKGVVCLTPFTEVTHGLGICEGVVDGLVLLAIEQAPIWCAMDCGSISSFPLVPGIESLTIFADNDAPGIKAARSCNRKWADADREVRIIYPTGGSA